MKKILLSLIFMMILLLCITSCGGEDSTGTDSSTDSENQGTVDNNEKSIYETLNELCEKEYSKITLDISTVSKGIELKSNYVLYLNGY